jgi:hypothetical protein
LSGLNLNWIILSQKILHQWKLKHQQISETQATFQFSIEQWSNSIEVQGQEFQIDGKWYDIQEVSKSGNTITVHAQQDKWEYVFQNIIRSKNSNNKNATSIASIELWKYVPSAHQLIPYFFDLENKNHLSSRYMLQVPSGFHRDLLRPPSF